METTLDKTSIRNTILSVEEQLRKLPNVLLGDCFPLKHTFADGIYVREISIPKGHLVVGKIHKHSHPNFLLSGEVSVLTEEGAKRIKGPCSMISPAGTKRLLYTHEDTVWITVHKTDKTDLKEIEEEIIVPSYDLLPTNIQVQLKTLDGGK